MTGPVLAIDFGTSNSAAAVMLEGNLTRIPLEGSAATLPTAVFFPAKGGAMKIGEAASDALIDGEEGRYMRALKSVLGTPLLHEPRLIGGKRRSVAQIITAFLAEVKARAEAQSGLRFTRALSGRPVHFHSNAPERDAQARPICVPAIWKQGSKPLISCMNPRPPPMPAKAWETPPRLG